MTTILAPFKNVTVAILDLALQELPGEFADDSQTGTLTPDDLEDHLPFLQTERLGGHDDLVTDHGSYDVDVFAATYSEAVRIAELVRQLVVGYPHRVGTVIIDYAHTEQAPVERPWANDAIRRFGATYQLSARR